MIKNYLVTTLRSIRRHKLHSFVNIFGLAVGFACSILVGLYVWNELSYDRFHEKADRIYRVAQVIHIDDRQDKALPAAPILAETLLSDFPEVEAVSMVTDSSNTLVKIDDQVYEEKSFYSADHMFFEVFSFELHAGDKKTALAEANQVVLTRSTAERYFKTTDPMGEILLIDEVPYTVTGIAENPPINSHIHFSAVTSLASNKQYETREWFQGVAVVYVVLQDGVQPEALEAKFPAFVHHYYYQDGAISNIFKNWELYLQPLTWIHLHSDVDIGEFETNGNAAYVTIFGLIAVFILVIAGINFVNLTTARAAHRAKEIGVRKVVGSRRSQLVGQFLGESIIFSLLALGLGLGLIRLLLPVYRSLTGIDPTQNYLGNPIVWLGLLGLTLVVGLLAGLYPALYLSAFQPGHSLKGAGSAGSAQGGRRSVFLGRGLVVLQFAISITLLIGTGVVYRQLTYMQNKRLGYDREHVLVVKNLYRLGDQTSAFSETLQSFSGVEQVSLTSNVPGTVFAKQSVQPQGFPPGIVLELIRCDYNLQDVLKFEMSDGRFFSKDFPSDDRAIIINQETASQLGWTNPLEKSIRFHNQDYTVIGVVRDFHFESLHVKIKKMGIRLNTGRSGYAVVRFRGESMKDVLAQVEKTWDSFSPPLPVEYSFLDDDYTSLYLLEMKTRRTAGLFSGLAVFISSLGLFGLAAYTAERRRREIGIRKILGASVPGVVRLISREYTLLVVIANLVAWPSAYFMMSRWLQGFAYRTGLGLWIFVIAGSLSLVLAVLTVAFQSIRAAVADPVEALRCE